MINNKILIVIFAFSTFLLAEDCYVSKTFDPNQQDGSSEFPYATVQECVYNTPNSSDVQIYVGPGTFNVADHESEFGVLNIGSRKLQGHSIRATILSATNNNVLKIDSGSEVSHVQFNRWNNSFSIYSAITTENPATDISIHNCWFAEGNIYLYASDNDGGKTIDFRNNVVESSSVNFYQFHNGYNIMNNLFRGSSINFPSTINFEDTDINVSYTNFHHNMIFPYGSLNSNTGCPDFSDINDGQDNISYNAFLNVSNNNCYWGNNVQLIANDSYVSGYTETDEEFNQTYIHSYYRINGADMNSEYDWYDYGNHFYTYGENSIFRDSGHPDWSLNDPDGSRADIGIMGGLYPWTDLGPKIMTFNVSDDLVPLDASIQINVKARTE